jgi:hypothetical protein
MRQSLLTISLTVVASVVAVVACGPASDSTKVRTLPVGHRAAESCSRGMQRRLQIEVKPESRSVTFCASDDESIEKPKYRAVKQGLRYSIGKGDRQRLVVSLKVGVNFPEETKKETRTWASWVLTNVCAKSLEKIWKDSTPTADLKVSFIDAEVAAADSDDPQLYLASVPQTNADAKPRFVNAIWPDRGELVPFGDEEQRKACLGKAKSSSDKDQCKRQALIDSNQRFCANFVVLAGHFLGVSEDAAADEKCESTAELRGGIAKSALRGDVEIASGKPLVENFFKNVRFLKSDVATILEPACSDKVDTAQSVAKP